MFKTVQGFVKSIDFFKSVTLLFAILVPLGVFNILDEMGLAVSVVMGVFLCSPSDVPGSMRHMAFGILISSIIATLTTLIIHLSFGWTWAVLPVLGTMVFANSMLSVYGFRASLVSFSGLLAIILAFARPTSGMALLVHAGLILTGGVWYLGVTLLAHSLVHRRHNQLILAECMILTAKYLNTRGRFLQSSVHQEDEKQDELFLLQTEINEKHEKLRELFVEDRLRSGASYSANKYILILIELIDILELAISNPANYQIISKHFQGQLNVLKPFVDIINVVSQRLEVLSRVISGGKYQSAGTDMHLLYQSAEEMITNYLKENHTTQAAEGAVILRNLLDYEQKQQQKVESIERVLQDLVDQEQLMRRSKDVEKFITHQDYDLSVIKQNLNSGSTIFRHAIRLTFTVLFGYTLGTVLPIQMPYWIMLTIIVIMRPSYGLTKSRSIKRVYGTLIGGVIALGIVLFTQNPYVYGVLAAVSLVFAFSLVQKNYGGSAIFITLIVIFLYALIKPNALNVIQYRVVDTAMGAGLSFLASLFFWPSWEFMSIHTVIADSIKANRNYLREISVFYQNKGEVPTSYKLARKEAFLAIGNLSAAFQRMSQEPKSKRLNHAKIYDMVVLNHTFLTAAAALGTFIQNHVTTEKSQYVQAFIDSTDDHLERAQTSLSTERPKEDEHHFNLEEAKSYLEHQFDELVRRDEVDFSDNLATKTLEKYHQLQEAGLVSTQLNWLYSLSESIQNIAEELKTKV
ncbi:putative membrane protein YccC [Catalinimonas alkaloidigena]|uniref:FUSC family protein n=1 Tax=Catalinimonas alkaloidigena TaxID=1075417 RepID=UPI0024066B04|nr:FUSC family membrane protein [Catalinimonas alkaloidigena]MDF9799504.1 putative membrane protein YccC [Catalinimonas alkaloidigena]